MDENTMESALRALGSQRPRPPERSVEDMVKTVNKLGRERARKMGKTAVPELEQKLGRQRRLSTGKPEKDRKKTL